MSSAQSHSRNRCSLLAVVCGNFEDDKQKQVVSNDQPRYPFPALASAGRLEVQVLKNPSEDEFRHVLESSKPNFIYLRGECHEDSEEVGSLVWGDTDLNNPEALCGLFGPTLPATVYLEMPNGVELAEALHAKEGVVLLSGVRNCRMGIPYIIYWKNSLSRYAACHFRHALLSVVQSSFSHMWDAFQLAYASFQLYCVKNKNVSPFVSSKVNSKSGPCLLGDPPKTIIYPEQDVGCKDDYPENLSAVKIYDENVDMRFLICGMPCELDVCLLRALEDGLKALLSIEMRGSKLLNRTSAPPPPLQTGTFNRGVLTMRCDVSTSSSAHVSLLVSGSAQACFNEQLLENHIKSEIIENRELVNAVLNINDSKLPTKEPRTSVSIACGSSVFEVSMKVPSWASQVLRQLATDVSYRSLVVLGIASIQGLSVASFEKEDSERLLFFCTRRDRNLNSDDLLYPRPPVWCIFPTPSRKRSEPSPDFETGKRSKEESDNGNLRRKLNTAMTPIPHAGGRKIVLFSGIREAERPNGDKLKAHMPMAPPKHNAKITGHVANRKISTNSYQAQQIISLNPLPLKKHGCDRPSIQVCSEEEFLNDLMHFLILRGHTRLVPQGGLAEFPDAVLNAKRLDLFNLYREVVSRGGFHVGNGINWKGQVFSKMRNHTMTNRMTGVGNTLKRHYETYLLEYELAHEDVDGECCLLCHSAAGDWVNCGVCGEWAHFGCDRRQALGAFKDYAKTDGLEYICPHCSVANFKKPQKTANGVGYQ